MALSDGYLTVNKSRKSNRCNAHTARRAIFRGTLKAELSEITSIYIKVSSFDGESSGPNKWFKSTVFPSVSS